MSLHPRKTLVIGKITDEMRAWLNSELDVSWFDEIEDRDAFFAGAGADIPTALSFGAYGVPGDLIEAMPGLRMISNYGVGYDKVDVSTALSRGIVVTHTPDVLNDEVANTAVLLLLSVFRKIVAHDTYVRQGRWLTEGEAPLTRSIRGCKVGIVGLGRIGEALAEKLEGAFGAEIVYHNRRQKDVKYPFYADLVQMARDCDAVVSVLPGGPATNRLIGTEVLDALGPEGVFVNIGRGAVVDEPAMIAALAEGRLGGAGLDVFEAEPKVPEALFAMENVVLQPHVGSATVETRRAMGKLAVDNVLQFIEDGTVITAIPECK